ncbi:BatD family protein [Marinobacter sp. 2_MG-2023]|uniref:BatD family protein n=1 Tax=Marinobacter sp. 2_MG-2023 TaxID=3062679 RepID=UPI0026E44F75|nr:BatD family protein [Marinobacter sp. 2_MG-2023]MDO6440776.1 BatD family protein [Marinobacter sp. 2_MG-2023]
MVKRFIMPTIWLLMLMMPGLTAHASELTVEPDRTRLYEGEVLTLTVKGTTEIDINLSNLFDFDISSLPSPDIEKVSSDFEILGRNQQYSIRTINGDMVGEITWTYQLSPRSTGEIVIPALSFKDSISRPVTIEVVDGNPPEQANANRDVFIELAADKAEVYVQEQLILTVRLFFRGNLIRGELSDPQHPNAIIESLGKQRELSSERNGVRYRVVERRYALFPQKPGSLNLPAIRFEGQTRDPDGSLRFLRDSAELFEIPVKDVPADFSGSTWLPATSLSLAEAGMPPTLNLKTGDNLTRTLSLQANGLPSEALPPLPDSVPDGLRSYPEEPQRNTSVGPDGITSTLTQTRALVPVQAGKLVLPAIRVPWWDTESNSEKVAVIPAQTLNVTAADGAAIPSAPSTDSQNTATEIDRELEAIDMSAGPENSRFWQWASIVLAVIWVLTLLAWWRTRRIPPRAPDNTGSAGAETEDAVFEQLLDAAQEGRASTPGLLVRWANLRWPGHNLRSAKDIFAVCPAADVAQELDRLQAHLFSRNHSGGERSNKTWDGSAMTDALKKARKKAGNTPSEAGLPPLYPGNLSV